MKDIRDALVSEKLTFYVVGGCAIGSVRYGGFIPWDNDVDLVFFEKDKAAIEDALKKHLDPSKYTVQCPFTGNYQKAYYRVLRKNTSMIIFPFGDFDQGVSVEMFPLCDVPDKGIRKWIYFKTMRIYQFLLMLSAANVPKIAKKVVTKINIICRAILRKMSENTECECVAPHNTLFFRDLCSRKLYGTPKNRTFEGEEFPFPELFHEYLTHFYGDYMTPPPEKERNTDTTAFYFDLNSDWSEHVAEARENYFKKRSS